MKKRLFLCACLVVLLSNSVASQAADPEVVVVRVHESYNEVEVVVTRGRGKSETLNFSSSATGKGLTTSAEGYQSIPAKLYLEGFGLTSTFTSAQGNITTLVFTKGD